MWIVLVVRAEVEMQVVAAAAVEVVIVQAAKVGTEVTVDILHQDCQEVLEAWVF
jgi:hypothetical protein